MSRLHRKIIDSGLLLVVASFIAGVLVILHNATVLSDHDIPSKQMFKDSASAPVIARSYNLDFQWTIFVTPQGFVGSVDSQQRRAIESWQRLIPRPRIILAGRGVGFDTIAAEYGITIDPHLDLNLITLPLAGSLIKMAAGSLTDIACVLNSDILLTQTFVSAIAKIRLQFPAWFLTGARYDVNTLPYIHQPNSAAFDDQLFTEYVTTHGVLHAQGITFRKL